MDKESSINLDGSIQVKNDFQNFDNNDFILKKSRDKRNIYYDNYSNKIEKYSGNYTYTTHNFVIQNISGEKKPNNNYYKVICLLKNILLRGCPTKPSEYLIRELGDVSITKEYSTPLHLISNEEPVWIKTIKGDDTKGDYPAITFFEEIIPKYLNEYNFIQNLIIPEVPFSDIISNIEEENEAFINQQVDFYLEQAKLVIEIDGQSHKIDDSIRVNDKYRDEYLKKYGITTIRIDSLDIKNETKKLISKINEIKKQLILSNNELFKYKQFLNIINNNYEFPKYEKILKYTAIIRFQILLLSLLEKEKIKFDDKFWSFNIVERDIKDFAHIAIEDVLIWAQHLCQLNKIKFKKPKINLTHSLNKNICLSNEIINIDFSLYKRYTDENDIDEIEKNKIYVRSDYFNKNNYFQISTDNEIKYNLDLSKDSNDLVSLKFLLKNIFGFDNFNDGQLPVIVNSLKGEDTIGLLPTGSGKSLIYQFVALLQPCVTFVVVPIKSLMKDQRDGLDKRKICNTNFINSNQSAKVKNKIQNELGYGKYQIVWISPERFQSEDFRNKLEKINSNLNLGLAVIDEVHCLSEWGHDFRTSYLNLSKTIKKYCNKSRILGLTATASINVLKDIMAEFDILKENVKTKASFTREELNFHIIKDDGKDRNGKLLEIDKLFKKLTSEKKYDESGIIFTQFVNNKELGCYGLSNYLKTHYKKDVRWYAGSIPRDLKGEMSTKKFQEYQEEVQEQFINNQFDWLIATKSFGMGIDKPNIRNTIHFGIPPSLESLYQEAGRAGRDKQKANCYILISEEQKGKEYFKEIFDSITTIDKILKISDEIKYHSRDVFNCLNLFISNSKDINVEFEIIRHIYLNYADPSKEMIISEVENIVESKNNTKFKTNLKKFELEKAIYKLSLLGIVNDWTIESWDEYRPQIKVAFKDYNEEIIEKSLLEYIQKYDKEFSFKKNTNSNMSKYLKIYNRSNYSFINKMIHILLLWQYENILYHRLQSIYTVYTQCTKNQSEAEFKEYMEQYFKFDEDVFKLDYIAEDPENINLWRNFFFNDNNEILSINELNNLDISLRRFLESYKSNTGLNFISGMIKLINGEYLVLDEESRLESSFEEIKNFSESDIDKAYETCISIGKKLDIESKNYLSKLLHQKLMKDPVKIYLELNDQYSLNEVIKNSTNRIKKLQEEKIW